MTFDEQYNSLYTFTTHKKARLMHMTFHIHAESVRPQSTHNPNVSINRYFHADMIILPLLQKSSSALTTQ